MHVIAVANDVADARRSMPLGNHELPSSKLHGRHLCHQYPQKIGNVELEKKFTEDEAEACVNKLLNC